ncbi:MAG: hypothetical protein KC583_05310 [Myxococcales bacterium]|nr:hypothetical protein [Myxococcales bacterium]
MRLWSFQHQDFIQQLAKDGIVRGDWRRVESRWVSAYGALVGEMARAGVAGLEHSQSAAPIWAWHSCGAWQRGPVHEDVLMHFGSEDCNRSGHLMVELEVLPTACLLSAFGVWCDYLERVETLGVAPLPPELFVVQDAASPAWPEERNHADIQATLACLQTRQVVSVHPLPGCDSDGAQRAAERLGRMLGVR